MFRGTRKRGHADAGDGDGNRAASLLGVLGLGSFARLELPAPTLGLDLTAAMDLATGCITVSLGGICVTASPTALAAALALPLGPVSLAPEVDAAVFSSAEAIATVRGFVHDRLLLGGGEDVGALAKEALSALRLVEEGKAYLVDWGRLVWSVLQKEVLTGKPRRYRQHLLRLIECQRPELFSGGVGTLRIGKRRKCLTLQQGRRTDDWSDVGVEEENLLHGNRGDDQHLGTEAEVGEGLFSGASENIEESLIREDSNDDQCRAAEACGEDEGSLIRECINYYQCQTAEEAAEDRLVSAVSHNMGELEDMPIFENVKEVSGVVSLDYKRAIVEEGGVHGIKNGNEQKGDGSVAANYHSSDNSSFPTLSHLSSPHMAIFESKPQSGPYQQPLIEIEDEEEDGTGNVDGCPSPPVIRTDHFNHMSDQSFLSFNACLHQILAYVPNMENAVLDMGKTLAAIQAEVQHMREALKEKDNVIKSTIQDILNELKARCIRIYQLEQDKEAMRCTFQEYKQLFQKSSAAFQEYKNRRRREGGESAPDVITMADGQNQIRWIQKNHSYQMINEFQKHWFVRSSECADKITQMATKMSDLNNEVQKLKNSMSVPDLNKDEPQL